jgi:gamma-glutamylcyclotransferase (GGCT)/AIG2-like uncharacterized protein YtfP
MAEPTSVFVYGTLKRGKVREKCWPKKPVAIEEARVRGALYSLGSYPALTEGDDVIAGELWRFAAEDMAETLAKLDEVEGFAGRDDDEYRRIVISCETAAGAVSAWTYWYARVSELRVERRVGPDDSGNCSWSGRA